MKHQCVVLIEVSLHMREEPLIESFGQRSRVLGQLNQLH
jgi:hypothetical protein